MELRQLEELKQNVPASRKKFIRLVRDQDTALDDLLDDLVSSVDDKITQNTSNDRITSLDRISLALPAIFLIFINDWVDLMETSNVKAATIIANDQAKIITTEYRGIKPLADDIARFERKAQSYPDSIVARFMFRKFPDGITIGQHIKTVQKEFVNVSRSILEVGVREGKSATQIAYDLKQYLKPLPEGKRVSPFTWVRDFFGRPKVQMIEKGEIPAGSVSYNAFRIARTEINNTYRNAVVELNRGESWAEGFNWNLSFSHWKTDICDEFADGSPYKANNLPDSHPHCMCYVTVELANKGDFL